MGLRRIFFDTASWRWNFCPCPNVYRIDHLKPVDEGPMSYEDKARQIADTAEAAAQDARAKLAATAENVKASASELAQNAANRLQDAGVDTDRLMRNAKSQAQDLQAVLEAEVRERPLRAIGVAALVGLAFGLIAFR
jgi:ElaB/YqjD/DUF883 family membrane-anchored ribosome-binding protein